MTAALTKGRHAAREDAVPCTLVKMADGTFCLCAGVTASKVAAMVKEAEAQGGKILSAGDLYNGDEGPTFAVTEGSASIRKQFSDGALTATGKAMTVTVLAAEGAPTTEVPAAAPQTDAAAAAFKARLSGLVGAVKQASAGLQAQLQPLLIQAVGLGKEARYAEAAPLLDKVEHGLAAPPPPPPPPPTAPPAPHSEKDAFAHRLKEVNPRYVESLRGQPSNKAALESAMAAVVASARDGQFAAALQRLAALEKLLAGATTAPASQDGPAAAPKAPSLVDLQKMRLAWAKTRDGLKTELEKLEQAILAGSKDQDEFDPDDVAAGVKNIFFVLEELDAPLLDKLDEALNAPDADRRARLQRQAKRIVAEYLDFINADPMMAVIDDHNGFAAVSVRKSSVNVLTALAGKL